MAFFKNGFPFGFDESGMGDDEDFGGFGGFGGSNSRQKNADKPVDTTKLYEVLDIEKTATSEEIRKAYKKMAYKHHPDRGGDQAIFQEVQHAYEILSDENKRKVYDTYGEEGLKDGRGEEFEGSIFDLLHGQTRGANKRKSKSVLHTMEVTLEDIYVGKSLNYDISRYRTCHICKGSGAKESNANTKCKDCQGKGIKIVARNIGYGYIQQSVECSTCKGEGRVIKDVDKCVECKGERAVKVNETLSIYVEKGSPSGKKHVFAGESDEVPGLEPGDAIVEILIKGHKRFQRKGADLIYTADISLLEALTGFNLIIQHLDGRQICVKNVPGEIIKPGVIKTVKECGLPFFEAPYKYGNLYINFNIKFPEKLEKSQAELLNNV
jgi:DnaJ family protein A protein 2